MLPGFGERGQHRPLERLFPLRRVACGRQKAERQHARRVHRAKRFGQEGLVHTGLLHVAQVAEQSERAEIAFTKQTFPGLALIGTRRECYLPGVRSCETPFDQPLPQVGLFGVARLGVAEEQYVTQADRAAAVVLRQLIFVELAESLRESLFRLRGKRGLAVLPVDGDEFGEFVGALDHASERFGHARAMLPLPRHFARQQQRSVTQLHR